ncbi:MAG: YceD family protein [Bacilli bacterium]|jgi:uncharacterized protein
MKWTKTDLLRLKSSSFSYQEKLSIDAALFDKAFTLLELKDVQVAGKASYDSRSECLSLNLTITGIMVLPCARCLEPVDYPFETSEIVIYSFQESSNDEFIVVKGSVIDTTDFVRECIMLAIPIRVIKEGVKPITAPVSDVDIDQRLVKLKDYFKD